MPLYEYQCQQGHVLEEYREIKNRELPIRCYCGYMSHKVILHAPRVFGDLAGYESPTTGRWIEGKRARIEDLKRSECRPYEAGEREDYERKQKIREKILDAEIDAAVDQSMELLTQHDEGSDARHNLMRG